MKPKTNTRRPPKKRGDLADTPAEKPPFLQEGVVVPDEENEIYDLEREFAKSRANRSVPIYAAIAAFAVLLGAVTAWFTFGIQRDIDRMSVGIADFRDINLQELLNALQAARLQLDKMDETITIAKQQAALEIEKIRLQAAQEIKKVEQSGLGQAEKRRLINDIRAEQERKIGAAKRSADLRIKDKQREADAARTRLEALEKQVARERVAAKKFDDEKDTAYRSKLDEQRKEQQARLKEYDRELKDVQVAVSREAERASDTENLLNAYKRALTHYAKSRGEHGYVIDTGDGTELLVNVNPHLDLRRGDRAYVLNKDSKIIAMVELQPAGIRTRARVISRNKIVSIQPFDKILLRKN